MALEVRIPREDGPKPWSLALVAAAALGIGIGLAAWAADPVEGPRERDVRHRAREASRGVASAPREEPARAATIVDAGATDAGEAALVEEAAPSAIEPETVADEANEAPAPAAHPARAPLSVVPGRVAYLRCDGVRHRRGPYPCPRDGALEAAVWPILDAIAACPSAPDAPGEADIKLDYRGAAAPEVGWRDTFPDDAVRLDRERVLGCVREALEGTRQSLGAERLLVSFRFSLVAP